MASIGALLEARGLPALPPGIPLSNVLVGLEAGVIVGAVALDVAARRGLIVAVAVAPEQENGSAATSLLGSLISRAHELGLRELYTATADASDPWSHFGFSRVGEGALPDEVRFMRSFPRHLRDSDALLRLDLETRL